MLRVHQPRISFQPLPSAAPFPRVNSHWKVVAFVGHKMIVQHAELKFGRQTYRVVSSRLRAQIERISHVPDSLHILFDIISVQLAVAATEQDPWLLASARDSAKCISTGTMRDYCRLVRFYITLICFLALQFVKASIIDGLLRRRIHSLHYHTQYPGIRVRSPVT